MDTKFNFLPSCTVHRVAEQFARVLAPHLERRQLSLRGLRTAVAAVQRATKDQLVAMAIQREAANGQILKAEKLFEQRAERAIYEAVGMVLQVLPDDAAHVGIPESDRASR